jgi:hypothetical protein
LQWNAIKAAGKWLGEHWKEVVVVAAVVAVSVFVPGSAVLIGALAGAVGSGLSTALYGGSFSDVLESAFKGAVIGAISAGAFSSVGSAAQQGEWSYAAHVGAHAAVGGTLQGVQGGNFFTGALTSGLTQAAAPGIDQIKGFDGAEVVRVGAAATVGGTTSVISGGKFANGAVLSAFGRAFNDEAHLAKDSLFSSASARIQAHPEIAGFRINDPPIEADYTLEKAAAAVYIGLAAGAEFLAEESTSFFEGATYSDKVLSQMETGIGEFHSFPESVTAFEDSGTITDIIGDDGQSYQKLEIPGAYQTPSSPGNPGTWYEGTFQFIKDSSGMINHRLFVRP